MSAERLHLGCGSSILPGWINIDVKPYPGVDRVLDLRDGLPFGNAAYIFAEHFLEHLELDDALPFVRDCRRALADDGVLRLTTPNLDWVWISMYASRWTTEEAKTATIDPAAWTHDAPAARDCLSMNRSFRGWGHRFLYNAAMLEELLRRAGFAHIAWCAYGESAHEALRGIERHEEYPDTPAVRHLLIAEASGRAGERGDPGVEQLLREYQRDITVQ